MTKIAVFYLARRAEGFRKFKMFADSYRRFDAGIEHDLLIIAKGFEAVELEALSCSMDNIRHRVLELPDDIGFDLHAYLIAAKVVNNPILCFLNTHTRLKANGWLQKLYAALQQEQVGLVGAFGSYESLGRSRSRKWRARTGVMVASRHLNSFFNRLYSEGTKSQTFAKKILRKLAQGRLEEFPPFPNPHIRSNVFMLEREKFLEMEMPEKTKSSCFKFESGRRGLTARIRDRGLKSLVVGADGRFFGELDWPWSGGYRSGNQSNLLAEDNVTDIFRDAPRSSKLSQLRRTWGAGRAMSKRRYEKSLGKQSVEL